MAARDAAIVITYSKANIHIAASLTGTIVYVTRSEKSRLPRTQRQDTLFTIKQ